jgi:hypothetical protein
VPFQDLFTQYAATGVSRQLALADLLGDRDWELDLTAGTVTFGTDLTYPIQLLGTESEADGTWLWAWANEESNLPPALLQLCGWLREYGRRAALPELSEPTFPLDRADGHRLALLASGLTGRCYYRGPYEGGAVFFHLENLPAEVLAPVSAERALTALGQVIQSFPVDHRSAAVAFLHQQGWQVEPGNEVVVGRHPDGSDIRLEFDRQGRISQLAGQARAH